MTAPFPYSKKECRRRLFDALAAIDVPRLGPSLQHAAAHELYARRVVETALIGLSVDSDLAGMAAARFKGAPRERFWKAIQHIKQRQEAST